MDWSFSPETICNKRNTMDVHQRISWKIEQRYTFLNLIYFWKLYNNKNRPFPLNLV